MTTFSSPKPLLGTFAEPQDYPYGLWPRFKFESKLREKLPIGNQHKLGDGLLVGFGP